MQTQAQGNGRAKQHRGREGRRGQEARRECRETHQTFAPATNARATPGPPPPPERRRPNPHVPRRHTFSFRQKFAPATSARATPGPPPPPQTQPSTPHPQPPKNYEGLSKVNSLLPVPTLELDNNSKFTISLASPFFNCIHKPQLCFKNVVVTKIPPSSSKLSGRGKISLIARERTTASPARLAAPARVPTGRLNCMRSGAQGGVCH
jgi:hypothetical protein